MTRLAATVEFCGVEDFASPQRILFGVRATAESFKAHQHERTWLMQFRMSKDEGEFRWSSVDLLRVSGTERA